MVVPTIEQTAKSLAKSVAGKMPQENVQTAEELALIGHLPYPRTIRALRQLENMNAGTLYLGRRGYQTRFEWNSSPKAFAKSLGIYDWEVGQDDAQLDIKVKLFGIAGLVANLMQEITNTVAMVQ